jgi:general secretion pathway protein G
MFQKRHKTGFTLIELLVVIAILGLLMSIVLASLNASRVKARVSKVRADLDQMRRAINMLEIDTELGPGFVPWDPCVQDPELFLEDCDAGLQCTSGGFLGWDGPYMPAVPLDPWNNRYIFDGDYTCQTGVSGCGGIPDSTTVRAIHSGGPNGSGINTYDSDNIVLVLCR